MAASRVLVAVTDKSKELANSAEMFLLKRLQPLGVDQDLDLEVDSSQSSNQPLTSKRSAFAFRVVAEEDEEEDEDDLIVGAAQVVAGDQEGLLLLGAQLLNALLRLEAEEEKEEEEEGVEDVDSWIKCDCKNYLSYRGNGGVYKPLLTEYNSPIVASCHRWQGISLYSGPQMR